MSIHRLRSRKISINHGISSFIAIGISARNVVQNFVSNISSAVNQYFALTDLYLKFSLDCNLCLSEIMILLSLIC